MVTGVRNTASFIATAGELASSVQNTIESSGLSLRVAGAALGALWVIGMAAAVYCSRQRATPQTIEQAKQGRELTQFAAQLQRNQISVPSPLATKALNAAKAALESPCDYRRQQGMVVAQRLINKDLPPADYPALFRFAQKEMNDPSSQNRAKACQLLGTLVAHGYTEAYDSAFEAARRATEDCTTTQSLTTETAEAGMFTLCQLVRQKYTAAYDPVFQLCSVIDPLMMQHSPHELSHKNQFYLSLFTSLVFAGEARIYPLALRMAIQNEKLPNTDRSRYQALCLFSALESQGQLTTQAGRTAARRATEIGLDSTYAPALDKARELSEILRGVGHGACHITVRSAATLIEDVQRHLTEHPRSSFAMTIHIVEEPAAAAPPTFTLDQMQRLLEHLESVLAQGDPAHSPQSSLPHETYADAQRMKVVLERAIAWTLYRTQQGSRPLVPELHFTATQNKYLTTALADTEEPSLSPAAGDTSPSPQMIRQEKTLTPEQTALFLERLKRALTDQEVPPLSPDYTFLEETQQQLVSKLEESQREKAGPFKCTLRTESALLLKYIEEAQAAST